MIEPEPDSFSRAFVFGARSDNMRDKKDNATFDLPGFALPDLPPLTTPEPIRASAPRRRKTGARQEQLELLEATDSSGLPVWQRSTELDLTGLPVWAAS
ncbi:MAG: hypothetical protein ABIT83_07920 [Massilia sp.]